MTIRSAFATFGHAVLVLLTLMSGLANANDTAEAITAKVAIAHKIAKFVTWPDGHFGETNQQMRICVLGDEVALDAFEMVAKRPIHGRSLRVLPAPDPQLVAQSCDVLYLGREDDRDPSEWLGSVAGEPVLTFGEAGQYASNGTIVTMTIRRNRVSFSINLDANENTGLRISAQLLQLAASVGGPGA